MSTSFITKQKNAIASLEAWSATALGEKVTAFFLAELANLPFSITGESLLQLSQCGDYQLFSKHFQRHWIASPEKINRTNLITLFSHLPFANESIDCVIAPLILELFKPMEILLDELDRIVKPMGHIIFFGFNKFSFWNLWLRDKKRNCYNENNCQAKSIYSLQRAMRHRGYTERYLAKINTNLPLKNSEKKIDIFQQISQSMNILPAGFHCYIVQKLEENLLFNEEGIFNSQTLAPTLTMASYSHFK